MIFHSFLYVSQRVVVGGSNWSTTHLAQAALDAEFAAAAERGRRQHLQALRDCATGG